MIRPVLDIHDTETGRRRVPIKSGVIRLGRLAINDVQLLQPHVSKRHAEIRRRGEDFVIVDLESRAGVLVNGIRVNERTLSDGDLITFGAASWPNVVFRCAEAQAARPGAPEESGAALLQTFSVEGGSGTLAGLGGLERLARFLEFSRILGGSFSLDDILVNVVDLALELTGAERGFLIVRGLERPDVPIEYRVARGRGKTALNEDEIRASETIVRQVLESGVTRVVADVSEDRALEEMWSVAHFNVRSAVALPLRRAALAQNTGADRIFGVLYLDSRDAHASFDRIDRDILESLARDASAAIENARLLRESEEKKHMEEEMTRAREVQSALLPVQFWADRHFEASGSWVPSRRLGGDYLDQFRLPDGRCCLVIADVAGKGLPASLLAAALQGAMGAESLRDQPLGELVRRVNQAVCRLAPTGKYVTFFCCALAPDGALEYVNAGHVPPLVIGTGSGREPGRSRPLFTGDLALGIEEDAVFEVGSLRLDAGEAVVLYTDGVTEAADARGDRFEESRLEALLEGDRGSPAAEIVKSITEAVRRFSDGAPPQDDITVLVLRFLGSS